MIIERPVTFVNRNNCRLFGMLYSPEAPVSAGIGVIVSVNAIKYRVGTFGLHAILARQLAKLGYPVLTFDPQGIGDSEGEFEHKLLSEHYFDIQTGKYTNDLKDAIGFFVQSASIGQVVLLGLCGGAIATLMEAADDRRVKGLVLLNLPVLVEDIRLQGRPDNASKITSSTTAATTLTHKWKRLFELNFWRRLVRTQVDLKEELRLVSRSIFVLGATALRKCLPFRKPASSAIEADKPVSSHRLFNMHSQTSFKKSMGLGQQILFVFAELDPWTAIFKSEFQVPALQPGNAYESNYQIHTIAGSNHIFSGRESCSKLSAIVARWLTEKFPVSVQERAAGAGRRYAHE